MTPAEQIDSAWRSVATQILALAARRSDSTPGFLAAVPYLLGVVEDGDIRLRTQMLFAIFGQNAADADRFEVADAEQYVAMADDLAASLHALS